MGPESEGCEQRGHGERMERGWWMVQKSEQGRKEKKIEKSVLASVGERNGSEDSSV